MIDLPSGFVYIKGKRVTVIIPASALSDIHADEYLYANPHMHKVWEFGRTYFIGPRKHSSQMTGP